MFDRSKDVLAYHNEEVTLPQTERNKMRERRDSNRDRLEYRLDEQKKPLPAEFIKQGSYAMLTMVQDPDKDYDIDDGVYFNQESLRDADGYDMTPGDAKQMVCAALEDDRFSKKPKVKAACVRIFYQEGYHVDMPVYRIREVDGKYELAHDDGWVLSRAADTEDWFNATNKAKSPDLGTNGGQFRRVVRLMKKFARSRRDWKAQVAAGFTITKLAEECFVADVAREDKALRNCMQRMYNRLYISLAVAHPVTSGAMLADANDTGTKFLREKLGQALEELKILDNPNCTAKQAAGVWDEVYDVDFFSKRADAEAAANKAASSLKPAAAISGLTFPDKPVTPNKPAGFA